MPPLKRNELQKRISTICLPKKQVSVSWMESSPTANSLAEVKTENVIGSPRVREQQSSEISLFRDQGLCTWSAGVIYLVSPR
jgi:hypothetical protein